VIGKTIFIYGDGGTGKSHLLNTMPGPRWILDTEFRSDSLPGKLVEFNVNGSKVPENLDDNTTLISFIRDITDIQRAVTWIKSGKMPVRGVGVDSVTQLQQNTIDEDFKGQMRKQDWGVLLKKLAPALSELMKLAKDPKTKLEVVTFSSWHSEFTAVDPDTKEEITRVKPFVQGQLMSRLSHMSDLTGYTTMDWIGNKQVQKLQILPVDGVTAKDTYGGLSAKHGKYIKNPNIAEMLPDMRKKEADV
jgi:hypothetical protein